MTINKNDTIVLSPSGQTNQTVVIQPQKCTWVSVAAQGNTRRSSQHVNIVQLYNHESKIPKKTLMPFPRWQHRIATKEADLTIGFRRLSVRSWPIPS